MGDGTRDGGRKPSNVERSQANVDAWLKDLEEHRAKGEPTAFEEATQNTLDSFKDRSTAGWWYRIAVWICTRLALTLFLLGLVLTVVFVIKNVSSSHTENVAKTSDTATVNARNFYMSDTGKAVEKVVAPRDLGKGRQPSKLAPPPKAPVAPAPCPTKP
jgi:hypothetical protein